MSADQDYVNTRQAAEILGLSISGVKYLLLTGKLEAVKIGRDWLYERASVENYAALRQSGEIKPGVKKKS